VAVREEGARPLLLVYRALGLGDFLTGVPALRALRRAFPGHRLVLAAPGAIAPLAALSGAVDAVADVVPLAPLPAPLHGADVAVNLHGRGPQSHRVLEAARPRRLVAFGADWRADEHEVARWCRLLGRAGIPADPDDLDLTAPRLAPPPSARGATLIHPGASSGARRWPVHRWAAVARGELARGRRVAITAGPGEERVGAGVARAAGLPATAVLRPSLLELAAAVAAAARITCGDTGVAHLATALRTPSVVLFGPTPPATWGPPPDRPWHRALWTGRSGDPHALEPAHGLLAITPETVLSALETLPGASPRVDEQRKRDGGLTPWASPTRSAAA
jgi:ADP-heptose:LPS heptosyltransferase